MLGMGETSAPPAAHEVIKDGSEMPRSCRT
jgi:hypothetical protein